MDTTTIIWLVLAFILVIWGFAVMINRQNAKKRKRRAGNQKRTRKKKK